MDTYSKVALDAPELIAILKQRGLIFADENAAIRQLGVVSYFRLASFLRPLEADKRTHQFKPGSSLEQALTLYEFDTCLRDLIFSAIRTIEIALRTRMNNRFSIKHKPFWFVNADLANDGHLFAENLSCVDRELRRSKEDFIKEHFQRYNKPGFPPAWKTLETVSFGTLSKLYSNFSRKVDKKSVANSFGVPQHEFMVSWLESLTSLRNFCAHHSRVWNRRYAVKPKLPRKMNGQKWVANFNFPPDKLYPQLICISHLLNNIDPHNTFINDFKHLLAKYPIVDTFAMGFPANWDKEPLWL